MGLFVNELFENPKYYFCVVGSLIVSITLHEFCHAFMAREFGDDTAADAGHLTLDPVKQMGWMSIAALFLFGICWGAVPVDRGRTSRAGQSVISAAGPLTNLGLAVLCAILFRVSYVFEISRLAYIMYIALQVNCMLFIFNMLPIPILDGWGVLSPFVPPMRTMSAETRSKISGWVIFILWATPVSNCIFKASSAMTNLMLP